jgi:hypothetical protein
MVGFGAFGFIRTENGREHTMYVQMYKHSLRNWHCNLLREP